MRLFTHRALAANVYLVPGVRVQLIIEPIKKYWDTLSLSPSSSPSHRSCASEETKSVKQLEKQVKP